MGCARTGWTKARQRRQWAITAVATLVVGCCGGGGIAESGHWAHGRAAGLRSLGSGRGGEQGTGTARPGHWQRNGSRQGSWTREGSKQRRAWREYGWK